MKNHSNFASVVRRASRSIVLSAFVVVPMHLQTSHAIAPSWVAIENEITPILEKHTKHMPVDARRIEDSQIGPIAKDIKGTTFFRDLNQQGLWMVCAEMAESESQTLRTASFLAAMDSKSPELINEVCSRLAATGSYFDWLNAYDVLGTQPNRRRVIECLTRFLAGCRSFEAAVVCGSRLDTSLIKLLLAPDNVKLFRPAVVAGLLFGLSQQMPDSKVEYLNLWNTLKEIPGEPRAAYLGLFHKTDEKWKNYLLTVLMDGSISRPLWEGVVAVYADELPAIDLPDSFDIARKMHYKKTLERRSRSSK